MKKIKFFRSGSKKERAFLKGMVANDYQLTNKIACFYHFQKNQIHPKDLIVEFLDKKTFEFDNSLRESFENQTTVNKKIGFAPFYVSYTYLTDNSLKHESNEVSDKSEYDFLKYRASQLASFRISLIILGVLLWLFIAIFLKPELSVVIPFIMLMLALFWLISLIPSHFISKQVGILENKLGIFPFSVTPTVIVVFKNISSEPDISKLNFLGNWSFVTHKKNEYFYKLKSDFGREDIKIEINSALNIDKEAISISAPGDLLPIRF